MLEENQVIKDVVAEEEIQTRKSTLNLGLGTFEPSRIELFSHEHAIYLCSKLFIYSLSLLYLSSS